MAKISQFAFIALLLCVHTMAEIRMDKQVYKMNDKVKISYENIPTNNKNWIGVWRYIDGPGLNGPWQQTAASDIWAYTEKESGQFEFDSKKLAPGRYAAFALSNNGYEWLSNPVVFFIADKDNGIQLKTLAFNIWIEGTMVTDGFNGLVNEIIYSGADISLLSEVKNINGDFMQRLATAMQSKGFHFYTYHSMSDMGVLSRFPIKNYTDFNYFTKTYIAINDVTVAYYAAHLDPTHYAPYLFRGYEYGKGKLDKPVTDVKRILNENNKSQRPLAMKKLLADAKNELNTHNILMVSGDFNEPSPLDYIRETGNDYEHHGVVVPWTTLKLLNDAGFKDAYRVKYPDPVKYPGITWPSDNGNKDIHKIAEVPVDVRDRIDYTFYYPDQRLIMQDAIILGPSSSVSGYKRVEETRDDKFIHSKGEWPSDHKGVLVTFKINQVI